MTRPKLAALVLWTGALAAGCTSTDVLEPSAITPPGSVSSVPPQTDGSTPTGSAAPAAPAQPGASAAVANPRAASAVVANARIQFAPIVGTSVEAATALSERLATRARERGMVMTRSGDTSTTHVLKGYFTPLTEGSQTTVIYVWDVYDPAGARVHRISSQLKAPAGGKEGWDSVSAETMRGIAEQTIDQLADWLGGRTG